MKKHWSRRLSLHRETLQLLAVSATGPAAPTKQAATCAATICSEQVECSVTCPTQVSGCA
jgi:hypothetical protein